LLHSEHLDYDAVVIGAGISGLYQLYRLRLLGLRVKVFETGTGVGGTWYWNRYPGARFDSESYSYAYSFSQELLDEWDWTEHFAPQPETERYLQYVVDKFDLLRDIQFSSRVVSASYDDEGVYWRISLESGVHYRSRFMITAIGLLSAPTLPKIKDIDRFKGQFFHAGLWPKEGVSLEGKKVAIVGTGASGIQTIQEVAKVAKQLTVFQRRPNWCTPLHNEKISKPQMQEIKERYSEIFQRCDETAACFLHTPDSRSTFDVTKKAREEFWERLYGSPGFGIWLGNFRDILTDREANRLLSDFVARKIRGRVRDKQVADLLIPTDHGFGTRRVPQETFYYEVYNQSNVELVSLMETPFEAVTTTGLKTTDREYDFDIIVYATGFDAITGSFSRIDIRGAHGCSLKEKWEAELETFLGIQVAGFPNMFMILGPHSHFGNNPRSIEFNVEWVTDLIQYLEKERLVYAEVRPEAAQEWHQYVLQSAEGLLTNDIDSWMTGVNSNVDGKQKRIVARYAGTAPAYRSRCTEVAAQGYQDLQLF
jgi:cation diffusion facilitator CzcD-associated flavoprotein CzcO